MPRIPSVKTAEAGFLLKLFYKFAGKRFGAVPEPLSVSAHHPGLLRASGLHELMVGKASKTLPANVRELAVYRVATQIGCEWCVDFGTMLQVHEGLDIERLKNIDDYAKSPAFTGQERLALAYADAMTASPVAVTDEQVLRGGRAERADDRLGQPLADVSLAPHHGRPQPVQADPADDRGQPALVVLDRRAATLVEDAEPQPGLLDGVLGVGQGSGEPIGDRHQVRAQCGEFPGEFVES